jgi:hypothetical protein
MVTREKLPEGRNRLIGKVALVIGGGSIASAASWRVSTSSHHRDHDRRRWRRHSNLWGFDSLSLPSGR